MDYKKFTKDCERTVEDLSGVTFQTLDEMEKELIIRWKRLFREQTGRIVPLLMRSNILFSGIEESSIISKDTFFLFRIIGLSKKKIVYRLTKKETVATALTGLLKEAQSLDEEVNSYLRNIEELQAVQSNNPNSTASKVVAESRFNSLASSYQRVLMHTYEMEDDSYAESIRKEARVALGRQGMDLLDYNEETKPYFEEHEGQDCNHLTMVYPAIVRKSDNQLIAKGIVYLPTE